MHSQNRQSLQYMQSGQLETDKNMYKSSNPISSVSVREVYSLSTALSFSSCRSQKAQGNGESQGKDRRDGFFSQRSVTSLSHPADCLLGCPCTSSRSHGTLCRTLTAPQWLANNSASVWCHRPDRSHPSHTRSFNWNYKIRRENSINVYLLRCIHNSSSSHLVSPRHSINYFECNYGSNQLQPL